MSDATMSLWSSSPVATFDAGVIPDLLDESILSIEPELHDHIDEGEQKTPHILRLQRLPRFGLLHEQHDLHECQAGRRAMNARDRSRVRGNHAQVVEGLLAPELTQKHPIGSHAKTGLEERLWGDFRKTLCAL